MECYVCGEPARGRCVNCEEESCDVHGCQSEFGWVCLRSDQACVVEAIAAGKPKGSPVWYPTSPQGWALEESASRNKCQIPRRTNGHGRPSACGEVAASWCPRCRRWVCDRCKGSPPYCIDRVGCDQLYNARFPERRVAKAVRKAGNCPVCGSAKIVDRDGQIKCPICDGGTYHN